MFIIHDDSSSLTTRFQSHPDSRFGSKAFFCYVHVLLVTCWGGLQLPTWLVSHDFSCLIYIRIMTFWRCRGVVSLLGIFEGYHCIDSVLRRCKLKTVQISRISTWRLEKWRLASKNRSYKVFCAILRGIQAIPTNRTSPSMGFPFRDLTRSHHCWHCHSTSKMCILLMLQKEY